MSSSESSEHEESLKSRSNSESENSDSGQGDIVVSGIKPYENEPLASSSDEEDDYQLDEDGLSPAVLCARFNGEMTLNQWCKCHQCCTEQLQNPRECRCCHEVPEALHKLLFDASIEKFKCVTQHEDFAAMTNQTVLNQVGPMLKDRNGKGYRRRTGHSENDLLRAIAYRWLIRWICGSMGWDNTRPLPACVYKNIRQRFSVHHNQARGYQSAEARS